MAFLLKVGFSNLLLGQLLKRKHGNYGDISTQPSDTVSTGWASADCGVGDGCYSVVAKHTNWEGGSGLVWPGNLSLRLVWGWAW